jgi:sialate O-acetylesterase
LLVTDAEGEEWKTLLDLRGEWKFELGDNQQWADPKYDDSKWDIISVPGAWEDEGYPGYDGYAWYRKHFKVDQNLKSDAMYLHMGYVDDVSEVYLNGRMIGFAGQFPPHFHGADAVYEKFPVLSEYLNFSGDNVVAVRVFDVRLSGGITRGRVGLFELKNAPTPEQNLTGHWKFTTGDDMAWKEPVVDDRTWNDIVVPGYWETQGFPEYNGFGWYRVKFRVPDELATKRLILLLGKIDDVDETYLNGELIGRTGKITKDLNPSDYNTEWLESRAYTIPPNILLPGENVIAVRVADVFMHGGIYDGPVGLISREQYQKWKKSSNPVWTIFDWLFR